jgi:hypothetical protein
MRIGRDIPDKQLQIGRALRKSPSKISWKNIFLDALFSSQQMYSPRARSEQGLDANKECAELIQSPGSKPRSVFKGVLPER